MKNVKRTLLILSGIILLGSCEEEDTENIDFYTLDYRIGWWVTPDKKDSLQFVNSTSLIRTGFYYNHKEYPYKIENNTLIILSGTSNQTEHPILEVEKDKVVLDNMYISTGFLDNSGTFIKQ